MGTKTTVVNTRYEECDVYVGRPSMLGNPFHIGKDGSREEVIVKYEEYVRSRPDLIAYIKEYCRGKRIGCFCAPQSCHGDVIAKIADEKNSNE